MKPTAVIPPVILFGVHSCLQLPGEAFVKPPSQPDATDILTQMPSRLFCKKWIAVRGQRVQY